MESVRKLFRKGEYFDNDTNFFKHNIRTYEIIGKILHYWFQYIHSSFSGFSIWSFSTLYQAYAAICIFSMGCIYFFMLWDLYLNIIHFDMDKVLENLTLTAVFFVGYFRFAALVFFLWF